VANTIILPLIPPQGGYAAKKCPREVSNDHDPLYVNAPQDPPTEAAASRMADGVEFETKVGAAWRKALGKRLAVLKGDRSVESKTAREQATLDLMRNPGDVEVIWNARLTATDPDTGQTGERISEPDYLIRTRFDADRGHWLWSPGDVKHHNPMEGASKKTRPWAISTLKSPHLVDAVPVELTGVVKLGDTMQLAHYQRHLEQLGFDDPDAWGSVIGKPDADGNLRLVWVKLDWQLYDRERTSALESYDTKFDLTRQVIVRALARHDDPTLEPLVRPDKRAACDECKWRTVCSDDRKDADNITVLPGLTVDRAQVHYDLGVDTIARLSRLHIPTAAKVAAGETVTDSDDVDTARYDGTKVWNLVGSIDQARVWRAGKAHRARGAERVQLERMPIELDVDIEDVAGRVYLIGVSASGRRREASGDSKSRREYRSFVSWDDTDEVSARVLAEFWDYITSMRSYARQNHWGLRLYHYGPHEVTTFTKVARTYGGEKVGRNLTVPTVGELEDLMGSPMWVDMYPIVRSQVVWPTEDMTLKSVASFCGHTWRDTDPSGANSMAWYRDAIAADDSAERRAARSRVLAYNEDDCDATLAIRNWLSKASVEGNLGQGLPSVEDLDQRFAPRVRH
jgi:predicted RecB family nuclease